VVRRVQQTLLRFSKRRETKGSNTEAQWRHAVLDGTRYNYRTT